MLAVLFQSDTAAEPNPALQFGLDHAPPTAQGPVVVPTATNLGLRSLMPVSHAADHSKSTGTDSLLVHYTGSLTTPPCSEQVSWYVFLSSLAVAEHQVQAFAEFGKRSTGMAGNGRPLQPSEGRTLECLRYAA